MNKDIFPIVFLFFIIFFPFLAYYRIRGLRIVEILNKQALKRNGRVKKEWYFMSSSLSFYHRNAKVIIRTDLPMGEWYEGVIALFPLMNNLKFWFRLSKNSKGNITTKTNNESFAQTLISPDIQNKLLEYKFSRLIINTRKGFFVVAILEIPKDEERYDRFIDLSLVVYDRFQELSQSKGAV